ncbi:VOC family protein [Gottfriedia acidiceleris]|uniref:VOC family protein n=1 Tax=Gottfriedia acidiceleris TaxID=371036 RepID=UPI000B431150|nr:VOC family protein [Gottfriedia acidiceleris]
MQNKIQKISTNLWFYTQAKEAVNYYTSIFKNSKIERRAMEKKEMTQTVWKKALLWTIQFSLEGLDFVALNGGPHFKFTEAISFIIHCDSQEELDYYWEKLSKDGDKNAQACGWLKDQIGVSWQIVPTILPELLNDSNPEKSERVMKAILQTKNSVNYINVF